MFITKEDIDLLIKTGRASVRGKPNGSWQRVELFAAVGTGDAPAEAVGRGAAISGVLRSAGKIPPHFGMIVKHSITPKHLPDEFRTGTTVTFDFIPHSSDVRRTGVADYWQQTLWGSLAHLSLSVQGGDAFLTQLQGNIAGDMSPTSPLVHPSKMHEEYSNNMAALLAAAGEYCAAQGLKLHILHPHVYSSLSKISAPSEAEVEAIGLQTERVYGAARTLASRIFKGRAFLRGKRPLFAEDLIGMRPALSKRIAGTLVFEPSRRAY
ncbi:hypothetical protein COU36_03210 [Candidatus Micrarchaeota archaeon CG10_big_fil_rev_8_21_14_0_10_59_7]|nr:MAG: hypothetical protein COU36_03210 [Candidatus Micrarchaeota archaeon CG10_big_fil_rev_8_21_14_0_10_59_7]